VSESVARDMAAKLVGSRDAPIPATPSDLLSERELEVFDLLGQGVGTRQIAERLHVSVKTIQAYCARVKDKLRLRNATELLREATLWREGRNK